MSHDIASIKRGKRRAKDETPLPRTQIAILLLLHLAEPICATVIHPFIAQLVRDLDITKGDSSNVGYYVGLIESLFFFTEAFFVLQWGRLSDKIGRKPVLITGLVGLTLSMICFGLSSNSFWSLVASRALAGALNGNIGVLKSCISDVTDETNVGRAFSYVPITWFVGVTFAPLIGGLFSRPADHFPSLFSDNFWRSYPYFLPCLLAGLFAFFAATISFFFLKESLKRDTTHDTEMRRVDSEATLFDAQDSEVQHLLLESETNDEISKTSKRLDQGELSLKSLLTSRVLLSVANYGLLALLEISITAILPILLATEPASGGVGLSPPKIGLILGFTGLVNGVIQVVFFPKLHRLLGTRGVYTTGIAAFFGIFGAFAAIGSNARNNPENIMGLSTWVSLGVVMVFCPLQSMAFNCIFLYVSASAKSPQTLGATNGIAQTCASLARAIGPAAATSLFAYSNQHTEIAGGSLIYYIFIGVTVIATGTARLLPGEPWERRSRHERERP